MDDKKLIKKIYRFHLKQLKNLNVFHKKFMVVFSGIPGSGKTYIAKILEKRYKGVRIRTDSLRLIVRKFKLGDEEINEKILKKYYYWLLNDYSFKNKLIILDKGIDRKYKEIFALEKQKGYKVFTIRLKVSRKKSKERIIKKLGALDENYIKNIDRWIREWGAFGKKVKPDIVIENEEDLNLESLFLKLDKLVK